MTTKVDALAEQDVVVGGVYRLESAYVPIAVWNGEQFVGTRELFHLRLLTTLTRAEGGWVQLLGHVAGVRLVPELHVERCETCNTAATVVCERRGHPIIEEAEPNRALMAAIDEAAGPALEDELAARAANDTDEVFMRAHRWERRHESAYSPSQHDIAVLRRRLDQLGVENPQRLVIATKFPDVYADWETGGNHTQ